MNTLEQLKIIEQNALGHFAFLPEKLGFDVHAMDGIVIIRCGLGSSMFNIAYGTPVKNLIFEESIVKVKEAFKDQSFAWWVPPSQHNPKFTRSLIDAGLTIETTEHAMICDLASAFLLDRKTELVIKSVLEEVALQDFICILEPYDNSVRGFYERIEKNHLKLQEKLFVGYVGSKPITIGILFTSKAVAGIYSLLTKSEVQGKGYGTDMMRFLIAVAKKSNCRFVTLTASSDSGYRIYERLGFRKIGEFECFEYRDCS